MWRSLATLTRTVLVQWVQEDIEEELKTVSIDSHSDVVSRISIRESRVIGLWLEGHEVLEFFLFLGGQIACL